MNVLAPWAAPRIGAVSARHKIGAIKPCRLSFCSCKALGGQGRIEEK